MRKELSKLERTTKEHILFRLGYRRYVKNKKVFMEKEYLFKEGMDEKVCLRFLKDGYSTNYILDRMVMFPRNRNQKVVIIKYRSRDSHKCD